MHQGDELYASLRGPGKNMTVLATGHSRPDNAGTDRDEPLLMVLTFGKGRIFHTALGHDVNALSSVGFTTTFQRGTEWAATGGVTQKAPATFPSADTVAYRADLAAMDPDFQKGLNRLDPPPPPTAAGGGNPFAGTWKIVGDVVGNPVNSTCTLTVDGAGKVGGTCTLPTGETKATGEVKAQTLTFQIGVTHQGSDYVLVFTGTAQSPDRDEGHDRRLRHAGGIHGDEAVKHLLRPLTADRSPLTVTDHRLPVCRPLRQAVYVDGRDAVSRHNVRDRILSDQRLRARAARQRRRLVRCPTTP